MQMRAKATGVTHTSRRCTPEFMRVRVPAGTDGRGCPRTGARREPGGVRLPLRWWEWVKRLAVTQDLRDEVGASVDLELRHRVAHVRPNGRGRDMEVLRDLGSLVSHRDCGDYLPLALGECALRR